MLPGIFPQITKVVKQQPQNTQDPNNKGRGYLIRLLYFLVLIAIALFFIVYLHH